MSVLELKGNILQLLARLENLETAYKVLFVKRNVAQYASVETVFGKILDITEQKVIIKCLVNEADKSFQIRKFDKEPFMGAVNLSINEFVEIKIFTRSGERKFTYKTATRKDLKALFEPQNYFEGLENSPFFQPLASHNENNF